MKKKLKRLYIDQKLSLEKTGQKLGVSMTTVYRRLKKHGIRVRSSGELNIGKPSGALGKTWKLSKQAKLNHKMALLGKPKSIQHRINMGKGRKGLLAGEKNPNWRGGVSADNEQVRAGIEYRLWREAVFARDNYTCQKCGEKGGRKKNAHHVKNFADYLELRFAIDNGITFCKKCHKKFHKKCGFKNNDEKQVLKFVGGFLG